MSRRPVPGWGPRPPRPPAAPPSLNTPPCPLAGLLSQADYLLTAASLGRGEGSLLQEGNQQGDDQPNLEERLLRLHAAESIRDTRSTHLNLATNLLDRLVDSSRPPLAKLVVTLYPGDEGYTLSISPTGANSETELVKFTYEDTVLLDYLDTEELPTLVLDLLQDLGDSDLANNIFYSGCVICEVRDIRSPVLGRGKGRHVLLRPSTQSIICDSIALANKWTSDDRNSLESQLVLATEGPLCLDPNPVVSLLAAKAHQARTKFATAPLRRHAAKRYSQAGQTRKRKLESLAAPSELRLHDFLRSHRASSTSSSGVTPGKKKLTPVESLSQHQESCQLALRNMETGVTPSYVTGCLNLASPELRLAVPTQVDVQKYVRPIAKRPETSDMTPQLVEEYVLETAERGQPRVYHTRLTILQRHANDEYIGELYVERDYKEEEKKGSTCRFLLGTRTNALRYINQFTEIFTEEGRKNVKITHRVPNQPPRVTFTAGMRANMAAQAAAQAAAATSGAAASTVQSSASSGQPQILQKKVAQTVTSLPQVTAGGPSLSKSTPVVTSLAGGTITVSSGGIGPVSIQLQPQQSPVKIGPIIQTTAGTQQVQQVIQTPQGHQIITQRVAGGTQVVPQQVVQTLQSGQQLVQTLQPGQVVQQQLTTLVPSSIASKLPTAPLARPELPSNQTLPSPSGQPATLQKLVSQQQSGGGQEEAISAIVQSLMRAESQFTEKKMEEQRLGPPSVGPPPVPISPGSVPQLPTVPVPQASLMSSTLPGNKMASGRPVSLSSLLASPHIVTVSSGPQVTSTMSQLAAQLARPVQSSTSLPTYSQALSSLVSPRKRLPDAITSPASQPSPGGGQETTPGLSALLADTPAADKPLPPGAAGVNNSSSNSLLERLVSHHNLQPSSSTSGSNLTPTASQLPSVHTQHSSSSNGSTEEITLQSLLSNPSVKTTGTIQSPTKHSPLLQQLQQPVRMYQPGLTSPRHPPASPRNVTSPRPAQSPGRQTSHPSPKSGPPASPRQGVSALQQQLMQPPAPRYSSSTTSTTTHHSILSAALSSTTTPRTTTVSLPLPAQHGLLAGQLQGLVQMTGQSGAGQQVVSVSMSGGDNTGMSNGLGQLVTGGQVQLVQGTGQQQVQLVNHQPQSGQMQLVNQSSGGQVQLVNQTTGSSGPQQVLVNNVPMQLSISHPVSFAVNLAPGGSTDHSQPVNGVSVTQSQVFVSAGGGQQQNKGVTVTSMANIGKLVQANGPNGAPTTVLLQGAGGGNILLPAGQSGQFTPLKTGTSIHQQQLVRGAGGQVVVSGAQMAGGQVMVSGSQVGGQVVVRPQQSPVLVHVPQQGGQNNPVQIVRSVALNNPNNINKASPSPSPVTSPQHIPTDSPLVVQLNHQQGGETVQHHSGPHFLVTNQKPQLATGQTETSFLLANQKPQLLNNINQSALNQTNNHLKIRQQRKQSLK